MLVRKTEEKLLQISRVIILNSLFDNSNKLKIIALTLQIYKEPKETY